MAKMGLRRVAARVVCRLRVQVVYHGPYYQDIMLRRGHRITMLRRSLMEHQYRHLGRAR